MPKGSNKCAACGQWYGRGHRCPIPAQEIVTPTTPIKVVPEEPDTTPRTIERIDGQINILIHKDLATQQELDEAREQDKRAKGFFARRKESDMSRVLRIATVNIVQGLKEGSLGPEYARVRWSYINTYYQNWLDARGGKSDNLLGTIRHPAGQAFVFGSVSAVFAAQAAAGGGAFFGATAAVGAYVTSNYIQTATQNKQAAKTYAAADATVKQAIEARESADKQARMTISGAGITN